MSGGFKFYGFCPKAYLWRLTYNTLVSRARWKRVRERAEAEWVRRFCEANVSESRKLKETWILQHRRRILEVVLPRVRADRP